MTQSDPTRKRALRCLLRYRTPDVTPFRRITRAMEDDLLRWAVTLDDEAILDMRGVGRTILAWIREHQPEENGWQERGNPENDNESTLGLVMKLRGWRIDLFWNASAGWFTARMVALIDRGGKRGFEGGYLVPYEDPIGVSGKTPAEALANLHEAVLEWA